MTDNQQASEDVLIELATKFDMDEYGTVNENGGYLIGEVRKLIRTEKLKLLAEVRERVVGRNQSLPKRGYINPDIYVEVLHTVEGRNSLRAEQKNLLTKLEAEL